MLWHLQACKYGTNEGVLLLEENKTAKGNIKESHGTGEHTC